MTWWTTHREEILHGTCAYTPFDELSISIVGSVPIRQYQLKANHLVGIQYVQGLFHDLLSKASQDRFVPPVVGLYLGVSSIHPTTTPIDDDGDQL